MFKTNIVVSNSSNTDESWYLVTKDDTSRAIRNYSYCFGSIEALTWLTIIGADYLRNKHHYHLKIRDTESTWITPFLDTFLSLILDS